MLIRSLAFAALLGPWLTLGATEAQRPIFGGLGVRFDTAISESSLGAHLPAVTFALLPENRRVKLPEGDQPWRYFLTPTLPHPLRSIPTEQYLMLNERGHAMRIVAKAQTQDCEPIMAWLGKTLEKKYDTLAESIQEAKPPFESALRITFSDKQIDVACGPYVVMDYSDFGALGDWVRAQTKLSTADARADGMVEQRRIVLDRRRAERFANEFTLGDRYRLKGAFGIAFNQPFAKNSTQKFPIDQPFYVTLPNLPDRFSRGDVQLEISPERHPIVIRGTFDLNFTDLQQALSSKYGTPVKSSNRHVIHKVSGNHVILKKLSERRVELAFIDTAAQQAQRQRAWERESEGL